MKKLSILFALLGAIVVPVFAATNFVILGDDFQAKINASAPGDTLVVQAGVYTGNLNFNKPLTVLRSGTNQIQFQGTAQIQATGSLYFSQCYFANAVSIQCTGTVSFVQSQFGVSAPVTSHAATLLMANVFCTNTLNANLMTGSFTNLQIYDSWILNLLTVTGGKTLLKRTTLNGLVLSNNTAFEGLRVTNNTIDASGPIVAIATPGTGTPFVAVQSKLGATFLGGYKVWLGYNCIDANPYWANPAPFLQLTNCESVLVGNSVRNAYNPVVYCKGGTLKAYNNVFQSETASASYVMELRSMVADIINNTFAHVSSYGLLASDGGGPITVRGCAFNSGSWPIVSEGPVVSVSYCCSLYSFHSTVAPVVECLVADPSLVAGAPLAFFHNLPQYPQGPIWLLSPSSPCINKGPPDPIYNDRDGSRNDIGYTGGPLYNPANYTNDNPMVFFLTGSPQIVFKGAQTNLQVNVGASAGH